MAHKSNACTCNVISVNLRIWYIRISETSCSVLIVFWLCKSINMYVNIKWKGSVVFFAKKLSESLLIFASLCSESLPKFHTYSKLHRKSIKFFRNTNYSWNSLIFVNKNLAHQTKVHLWSLFHTHNYSEFFLLTPKDF